MTTVKDFDINSIKEYENNPRINDGAVDAVAQSIKDFGFKVPIIIDRDGVIIAGHTRKKAAHKLGMQRVPCIVADDLTPEQVAAFRLADNKTAELAEWDMEKLQQELGNLPEWDLSAYGFEGEVLDIATANDDAFDVEEAAESITEPICQEGDVWQLGRHRLICGDSTDPAVVARLMNGAKADLLLTDPPYNVAYEGSNGKTIKNDNMTGSAFYEFLKAAFTAADRELREGAGFYIFHAESEGLSFRRACEYAGLQVRQCLVWVKNNITIGRQDYQWKHEPCLYGWKDGAAHYFTKDRTQPTVFEDKINISKLKKDEMKELLQELLEEKQPTTVLHADKPLANVEHPTMKPVKLLGRLIKNSTKPDNVVLDTFGGSGSTLIAAEQLGRVCRVVELDPVYCDVIIKRYEALTGEKAEKIA